MNRLKAIVKDWKDEVSRKGLDKKIEAMTLSGIPLNLIYTPCDIENFDYMNDLGLPGEYPFTRGVYSTMYRGRLWTLREYAGYGTAEETNRRFKYLLEHGQTGLSVAFDLPTQIGYDSDHPMAIPEVGKVGVAVSTLKDMEVLFDGLPIGDISTSFTINATAPQILAMYFIIGLKQGVQLDRVQGTVQNDILKEYAARNTYIYPPQPSMKLVVDIIEYCSKNAQRFNSISISGYHIREAGANAIQELAFTFANAMAYVKAAIDRGLPVDSFAPRLSFFFGCHNDFFEEIAKFRAARRVWAKIMKERFGARDPRSMLLRFHTQTCGCTLTAQQPEVNIIRVTLQALAAVLGGTQSLHTNSYDEALALPSEHAVRLAIRTQQVIAHESNVANTVDPLAGSYYVEYLTNEIEKRVWDYLQRIEEMGGAIIAIERGFYQREIAESAYRYQREIEKKDRIVVGVNEFITEEVKIKELLKVDPVLREKQIERLRRVRSERDQSKVRETLEDLRRAVERGENVIPYMMKALNSYATLQETTEVLKSVYGEYKPRGW
ncbi:MAG: methylmalonyl-CoA mutase family protein [Nitrososphaerales archaeon]|nr:methylmalonyl-CoA mutase family protein [Nitrososphaerales archaeon]